MIFRYVYREYFVDKARQYHKKGLFYKRKGLLSLAEVEFVNRDREIEKARG